VVPAQAKGCAVRGGGCVISRLKCGWKDCTTSGKRCTYLEVTLVGFLTGGDKLESAPWGEMVLSVSYRTKNDSYLRNCFQGGGTHYMRPGRNGKTAMFALWGCMYSGERGGKERCLPGGSEF